MIHIEGYINQQKLEGIFKTIIPRNDWLGRELSLPNSRRRYDFGYILNNIKYLVEFDGYQHYQNSLQVKIDREKESLAYKNDYVLIRFPYWVQLTTETLKLFFNIDVEIIQNYPHGFIDEKALCPASFCELGIKRFIDEYNCLPEKIQIDISESLWNKCKLFEREYIIPRSLNFILK